MKVYNSKLNKNKVCLFKKMYLEKGNKEVRNF